MPPPPPQTPSHPDESGQPLNQRPGQKAGDFIERDLWDFDEELGAAGGETEASEVEEAPAPPEPDTPEAGDPGPPANDEQPALEESLAEDQPTPADEVDDSAETIDEGSTDESGDWDDEPGPAVEQDADEEPGEPDEPDEEPADDPELALDLGQHEEAENIEETEEERPKVLSSDRPIDDSDWELDPDLSDDEAEPADEDPQSPEPSGTDVDDSDDSDKSGEAKVDVGDEFLEPEAEAPLSSADKPKPLRLSTTEWISLGLVLVLILGGLGWFLRSFLTQIPTRQSQVLVPDFPVGGELIRIGTATSFWREPIRSGPDADTARRDARLIPVIELKIKDTKGDGSLRVFFRDDSGEPVGDPATRAFSNGQFTLTGTDQLQLAATAGFDDEGKHAAYQTAQTEPWTVEVFEGPQDAASFKDFRLLFQMPISAERR